MVFLEKEEVYELFNEFDIITFKEIDKDGTTGLGKKKHWHLFNVIAKKKGVDYESTNNKTTLGNIDNAARQKI